MKKNFMSASLEDMSQKEEENFNRTTSKDYRFLCSFWSQKENTINLKKQLSEIFLIFFLKYFFNPIFCCTYEV